MNQNYILSLDDFIENFKVVDTAPEVVEDTSINPSSGVMVYNDPTGIFDEFTYTNDTKIDTQGDTIISINNRNTHTKAQLKTVFDTYKDNKIIEVKFFDSTGEEQIKEINIKEEPSVVDLDSDTEFFGTSTEDFTGEDIEKLQQDTETTFKDTLIRYGIILLFIILLLLVLSTSILEIIQVITSTEGISRLLEILS